MCGGTWIQFENQSQILTAAHCVMNSKNELHPRLLVGSWILLIVLAKLICLLFRVPEIEMANEQKNLTMWKNLTTQSHWKLVSES